MYVTDFLLQGLIGSGGPPGPDGPRGRDGKPGADVSVRSGVQSLRPTNSPSL